ncbi:MAG: SPOR domain-containing protein, partial [Bacteroidota bacterium]
YEQAEKWYQVMNTPTAKAEMNDPVHMYNYGELLFYLGKHEAAAYWFEKLQKAGTDDKRVAHKLYSIAHFDEFFADSADYKVSFSSINTGESDFATTYYQGGIVFASSREKVKNVKQYNMTQSSYLDLYLREVLENGELGVPKKFDKTINSPYHEGPAAFFDNYTQLIFTRNNYYEKRFHSSEESTLTLELFYSKKDRLLGYWSEPVVLSGVADPGFSNAHPTVSKDGKSLYFVSDRPGGKGGSDIYLSVNQDGKWSEPVNLGEPLNTLGNESFPFLANDSTLYFSSDGHIGIGGLDCYRYNLNTQVVENMGYPINTNHDDFAIIVNKEGEGYFSSNRSKKQDNIYSFKYEPFVEEEEVEEAPLELARVYYTVQILALLNPKTVRREFVQNLRGVQKYIGKDGFNRYTYGEYDSPEEAENVMTKMKARGYADAFIRKVARYNDLSSGPGISIDKLYDGEHGERRVEIVTELAY